MSKKNLSKKVAKEFTPTEGIKLLLKVYGQKIDQMKREVQKND